MTPTSPLAGLLTGLVDGMLIALLVLVVVHLAGRRQRNTTIVHPVAEDAPTNPGVMGELPKAYTARQ